MLSTTILLTTHHYYFPTDAIIQKNSDNNVIRDTMIASINATNDYLEIYWFPFFHTVATYYEH